MAGFESYEGADELEKQVQKEGRPECWYHSIFSTHPSTENRIEAMNSTENRTGKKSKDEFLKMIDGLPYGTSDEEGFVRYNVFYHPFYAIKFTFSDGWLLDNLPDKLIIKNNDSEIVMISDNLLEMT